MRRSIFVVGLVALLSLASVAATSQRQLWEAIDFTDPGGNDAQASIMYSSVATVPTLFTQFTTSDTNAKAQTATGEVWYEDYDSIIIEGATDDAYELTVEFPDVAADTTNVYGTIFVTCTVLEVAGMIDQSCFIADAVYTVTNIDAVFTVTESAGTLTLIPRKQEGTEAAASGQALATAMDMTATAETVINATLTGTAADLVLAAGDRLGLDFTDDVAGELQGLVVTFTLVPS